jgi:hypothetical protein
MTENTRQYLIVGGIGVGAVAVLAVLAGKRSSAPPATATPVSGPSAALAIPSYPAPQFSAAPISIVSSPIFNAPGPRPPAIPTTLPPESEHKCGCECDETPPPFTAAQVARAARTVRWSVSVAPVSAIDNQKAQFPPSLYPWLYQNPPFNR